MVEAFINPQMLVWARKRLHYSSQSEAAEKLGVTIEKLAVWESGQERPSFRQAQDLAKKLRIPFGYLYLSTPPNERLPLPDLRTVADVSPGRPSPDFLEVLYDALRKQEWYHEQMEAEGVSPLLFVGKFTPSDEPRVIATDISNTLGIDWEMRRQSPTWEYFLTALVRKAENIGVLVLRSGVVGNNTHRPLKYEEFRGFAMSDELAPLVFINGNDYKTAQIFTIVHELAHIWIGQSGVSNPDYRKRPHEQYNPIDQKCDSIAAEVLVPKNDFQLRWNSYITLDQNIQALATYYKVSAFVVLRRAYELGQCSQPIFESKYEELRTRITSKRVSTGGDFNRNVLSRNSAVFTTAVVAALAEGRVLASEAASLLNLKTLTLKRIGTTLLEVGISSV